MDELRRNLERLKLSAMVQHLDAALEDAVASEQGYISFLGGLVNKEILARAESSGERRLSAAKFPEVKTFDTWDWAFQKYLNVQAVKDLMSLHFVQQGRPVLLLGIPGTGKTHLSIAYGVLAALRGYTVRFYAASRLLSELYASLADDSTERLIARLARVDLLIIDDLRQTRSRQEYAPLFFELVEARHRSRATIISSNLSVKEWGTVLGNPPLTAAIVDRLMDAAHVLNLRRCRSYRSEGPDAPSGPDRPADLATGEEGDET
jgi:DNA replication protein DnaC